MSCRRFFCGISVQTSAVGVQYCTGSYLSVTPVYQLGKQLDVRFYYVAFTLSQGSLHQPGRSLHLNITNVANFCFNPVQFYDSIIPFEFQSVCKKIFRISFWLYLQNVVTHIMRWCAFTKYSNKCARNFFTLLQATSVSLYLLQSLF